MIYTVTLNPALDKTVEIPGMALDTVNRITEMRTDPGGKGINVSKVIAKLGGESCAAGILGGGSGKMLEKLLEGEPFATRFRFVEGQTRTNLKIIDREGHTNTDINEPGLTVTAADLDALLHDLLAEVHAGDIVVLAGSLPKGAPQDTYRSWTAACKKAGAWVFLDADGALLAEGIKAAPYLIKPNDGELSRLAGKKLETLEELTAEGRKLLERGIERVVISLGGRGALYLRKGSTIYAEGLRVPVGSTVGAGTERGGGRPPLDRRRRGERHVQRHAGRRTRGRRGAAPEGALYPSAAVSAVRAASRCCKGKPGAPEKR